MKQTAKSGLRVVAWAWLLGEALLVALLAGVTFTYAVGLGAGIVAGLGVLALWCLAIRRSSFIKLLNAETTGSQA